jgi:hypothetical protein
VLKSGEGLPRKKLSLNILLLLLLLLLTAIGLSPGGSSPTLVQTKIKITQNNYNNKKLQNIKKLKLQNTKKPKSEKQKFIAIQGGTHCTGGCVVRMAGLDGSAEDRISYTHRSSNS